jgi:hypothetical protein
MDLRQVGDRKGGIVMQALEIQEHARKLMEARGARALADAAQKAKSFEEQGNKVEAETWRKIAAALREMNGPVAS